MSNESFQTLRQVISLMRLQRRSLIEAEAASHVVNGYDAVLRHLQSMPATEVRAMFSDKRETVQPRELRILEADAARLSLDEIEKILAADGVSRRTLEAIAVGRFQVPRGSLRSLSSVQNLLAKLSTMVQNERAHITISEVAKKGIRRTE